MDELKTTDKSVVVPGETLALGMGFLPSKGTYREGDKILAKQLGLVSVDGKVIKLIPLSGGYLPKKMDVIIGKVEDVLMTGWRIDTFTPYSAVMSLKDATQEYVPRDADLTKYFEVGDYVMCKITNVTSQKLVDVTMKAPGLYKLQNGRVLRVNPQKVPRIIGKQGSMVTLLKELTGCRISVGQNGVLWIEGEPKNEINCVEAIKLIEAKAHTQGLTEKVKAFIGDQK